jgi:hypothetical protein
MKLVTIFTVLLAISHVQASQLDCQVKDRSTGEYLEFSFDVKQNGSALVKQNLGNTGLNLAAVVSDGALATMILTDRSGYKSAFDISPDTKVLSASIGISTPGRKLQFVDCRIK